MCSVRYCYSTYCTVQCNVVLYVYVYSIRLRYHVADSHILYSTYSMCSILYIRTMWQVDVIQSKLLKIAKPSSYSKMGRNYKKKPSTKTRIRKQLSKSDRKHLYEFGELHPAVQEYVCIPQFDKNRLTAKCNVQFMIEIAMEQIVCI